MGFRRVLNVGVLLTASVVILAVIVYVVGFERTLAAVGRAGWSAFAAVGLLTFLFTVAQAGAWAALNKPIQHRARFRTLVEAVVVGQAGNIVTPSTYLGGEPFKVMYLGKMAGLPYHEVAGAVLLSKYLEFLSFILVFTFSAVVAIVEYRDILFQPPIFIAGATFVALAATLLGFCAVLWVSLSRRWRPLTRLVGWLARTGLWRRRLLRLRTRVTEMEDQVSRVFCEEGKVSLVGFGFMLLSHAACFAKPLVFFLLGARLRLSLGELCLIFAAGQLILAIQITPSGVGMLDGGLIGVFALLGLNSAKDAATCMAYLLCLRLWDAVVIGTGALLGMRIGARILSPKADPAEPAESLKGQEPDSEA